MSGEQKSAERFPELYKLMESILSDTLTHLSWNRSSIYEVLEATEEAVAVERERCIEIVSTPPGPEPWSKHIDDVVARIRSSSPTNQETIEKIRREGGDKVRLLLVARRDELREAAQRFRANSLVDMSREAATTHGFVAFLDGLIAEIARALLADGSTFPRTGLDLVSGPHDEGVEIPDPDEVREKAASIKEHHRTCDEGKACPRCVELGTKPLTDGGGP